MEALDINEMNVLATIALSVLGTLIMVFGVFGAKLK